jgi:hypothetical protein
VQVAVVAVRVVEDAPDREVDVLAVRHRRVAARLTVAAGAFDRGADAGPAPVDVERVLVRVPFVRCVEVSVVQVVGMVSVLHGAVPAFGAVPVRMIAVRGALHYLHAPLTRKGRQAPIPVRLREWCER